MNRDMVGMLPLNLAFHMILTRDIHGPSLNLSKVFTISIPLKVILRVPN